MAFDPHQALQMSPSESPDWQMDMGLGKDLPINHGFPFGQNKPTRKQRVVLASVLAFLAAAIVFGDFLRKPDRETDFAQVQFGARAMLEGRNPYMLVGPGKEFEHEYPLFYPATAFVAAIPFTIFSYRDGAIAVVAISTFLLAYGMTADSWHRLPLFPSAAFIDSVHAAQWTIILTAALFLPWLTFLVAAKPQSGAAILASSTSRATWIAGVIGGLVLLAASFAFLPHWSVDWLAQVKLATHIRAPIAGPLGPIVLLALIRWRRPEAWLLLVSAFLPQTFMWYSTLMLLATAATYREACVLSLLSTTGFAITLLIIERNPPDLPTVMWAIFLASTYLPVLVAILRRPNVGEPPVWIRLFMRAQQSR